MKKLAIVLMALAISCAACSHDDNNRNNNNNHNNNHHGNLDRESCMDRDGNVFNIYGKCEGSIAKYCDENSLEYTQEDCSRNNDGKNTCGAFEYESKTYYGCIEGNGNNNMLTCQDNKGGRYDSIGKCDGNIAKYCDNDGNFVEQDCSKEATNTVCGDFVDKGVTYKACIAPNGEGCGNITSNGICDGVVLKYCNNGRLATETCPYKCAYTAEDYAGCYERCGSVDSNGTCDGQSKLAYCGYAYNNVGPHDPNDHADEVDVLVEVTCGKDEACGKKVNGEYDCLSNAGE